VAADKTKLSMVKEGFYENNKITHLDDWTREKLKVSHSLQKLFIPNYIEAYLFQTPSNQ